MAQYSYVLSLFLILSICGVSFISVERESEILSSIYKSEVQQKITLHNIPTILDLVGSTDNYACPEHLILVNDTIDPSFYEPRSHQRLIPKVIHMTSKSRCMTKDFADNIDKWRFPGHSLFIHDDAAVDRLMSHPWPEFPQLQNIMKCVQPGASLADVWRYVLLWKYGGIYTDIDNAPGPKFFDKATGSGVITENTDALFEQEREGFPSQYFFAASPHHPVMYFTVFQCLQRLITVESVKRQYIPFVTGPGATKSGVIQFMGGNGYPKKGHYPGIRIKHRNVTFVGSPQEARQGVYCVRATNTIDKTGGYKSMNITAFGQAKTKEKFPDIPCTDVLYTYASQDEKMMKLNPLLRSLFD